MAGVDDAPSASTRQPTFQLSIPLIPSLPRTCCMKVVAMVFSSSLLDDHHPSPPSPLLLVLPSHPMPSCPSLAAQRPKPGDDEPRKKKRRNHARREREREREDIFRATLVEVEVGIPSGRHRVRPRMERLGDTMGTAEGGESAPPPLMAPITHRWILHILCERGGEGMYGCHFFGGGACITGALFSFRCKIVLRRLLRPSARKRSFCGGRGDRPLTDGFGASRQRGGGKEGAAAMSTALLVVVGGGGRLGAEPLYATARHNKGEKGRRRIIAVKVPKLSVE